MGRDGGITGAIGEMVEASLAGEAAGGLVVGAGEAGGVAAETGPARDVRAGGAALSTRLVHLNHQPCLALSTCSWPRTSAALASRVALVAVVR